MEIFKANRQWQERPEDERFSSIQALYDATKAYADVAVVKSVPWNDLRVEAVSGDVKLLGKASVPALLTNWSFGQLAARIEAPAAYLRKLPATLAAQNLNYGLAKREDPTEAQLMFHTNGSLLLRALTSQKYSRIWNYEVAERLLDLRSLGWEPAVPDSSWDHDAEKVTALYASDHDMFAFLRSQTTVSEEGSTEPMYRGVIVENSEVGASALKMTRFLYRYMCGNHIIWGASHVLDISVRHVGDIRGRFALYAAELKRYAESSVSDEEARIASSKHKMIAATKEELLDLLFSVRGLGLSRKTLEASYDAVNVDQDGDPRTVWGFVQGATRHSQTLPYADARVAVDKAASKLIDFTF